MNVQVSIRLLPFLYNLHLKKVEVISFYKTTTTEKTYNDKNNHMETKLSIWRVDELIKLTYDDKLVVNADYAYKGSWDLERKLNVVQSLEKNFPIGVFHLQRLDNNVFPPYLLLDGVQRLQAITDVLTGKGFYFDMKKYCFTLDSSKFAHNTIVESLKGFAVSTEWKYIGATIEQARAIQKAISAITSKEIFVASYRCDDDSHEFLKRMNKCEVLRNRKKWYIGELQPIKIETLVTKNAK